MTYNVTLVRVGDFTVNEDDIATRLKSLFDDVIQSDRGLSRRFDELTAVTWTRSCPDRYNAWDLLIYFMVSNYDSVVQALNRDAQPGPGGMTTWRFQGQGSGRTEETGSEVYANTGGGDSNGLANLAFHEALHNKGHFSDATLHPNGGLAGATVTPTTAMTPGVRRLMAGILGGNRPQWLGGCTYYNDPLRGT